MSEEEETPYSPAGFEAPEVELNDGLAVCAGCEDTKPVSEMGVTADETAKNEQDALMALTRYYVCNDADCMEAFMRKKL